MSVETAALSAGHSALLRPRQNWILNPLQDTLFVVAAPLIVLGLALAAFSMLGPAAATYILLTHVVLTVAHHLPTFIRIYGDVDLFRRFKWEFIFGPLIPFVFIAGVLGYLNVGGFPLENVLYLFVLLALWDPWHFLMQHYGFMRIYDRHNAAPRELAARMDLLLCVSWFVFIMIASGEWLAGILEDLFLTAQLPLVLAFPAGAVDVAQNLVRDAAVLMTLAYGGYLIWCRHKGHFISAVKLMLFATTFGVMYLAYTPNAWILQAAPGWTFPVGFAALGIVHMTQYLAIVWRYNRSLAVQPARSRAGLFRSLHTRGGWLIGGSYVLLCLLYGGTLTSVHENRWLMSLLLAAGFTSTLMHYYFDGFIWKMRHRQNREHLLGGADPLTGASWWDVLRRRSALIVFLRQLLYFGLPMTVLTIGALWVWNSPGANYVGYMMRAHVLYQEGRVEAASREARHAHASMDRQLPAARKLAELQPTSAREAALAFLIYHRSYYEERLIPALEGRQVEVESVTRHTANVAEAIRTLERAIARGGDLGHTGREAMSADDGRRTLESWRREMNELAAAISSPRGGA